MRETPAPRYPKTISPAERRDLIGWLDELLLRRKQAREDVADFCPPEDEAVEVAEDGKIEAARDRLAEDS